MTRFKGPVFPSYRNAGPGKPHLEYSSHQGKRRQLRNLRNWTRPIIDSKDPNVIAAGLRVIKACKEEPEPEYSSLHLFRAAMVMSDETKQPWHLCMDTIMDKFDARKEDDGQVSPLTQNGLPLARQAEPEAAPKGPSLLSRLLRSLAPRPRLQGAEASAEGREHQQSGAGAVSEERPTGEGPYPTPLD